MKTIVLWCTFLSVVSDSFQRDIFFETDPRLVTSDVDKSYPNQGSPPEARASCNLGMFLCFASDTLSSILDSFQRQDHDRPPPKVKSMVSFERFSTAAEIDKYVVRLGKLYPGLVSVETIGYSHERRPIRAVKISTDETLGSNKPVIFIDAGIHAREWAAPEVALYTLYQLVENSENNEGLLDVADWIIVPLVNPDGYSYSMTHDRMWRKNRANTTDPKCKGVDLNRNFDVYFGGVGTSRNPCTEVYAGPNSFSEPESRALRDFALKYKNKINLYLTLHSYGKYFLYPWGYSENLPKDWKELDSMATKAMKALSKIYGTRYMVGSSGKLMGAATGGSDDWMKLEGGAKYSYTIELPAGGYRGFDLPAKDILPVCTEMFAAIATFAREIRKEDCAVNERCSPNQLRRLNGGNNKPIVFNQNDLRRRKDQNVLLRVLTPQRVVA